MKKVYIVAARRTPIGKFMGSLAAVSAAELASTVIRDIVASTGIDPAKIDSVIVGNVLAGGLGQGVARQASVNAGIPHEIPACGVNMICGSGMKSVMTGFCDIRSGEADLVLAGGTESMSGAGYVMPGSLRSGTRMGNITALDQMVHDGLTDAFSGLHMGITAENVAEKYGITREEQDGFAYNSQRKAIAALDGGRFRDEIVPVPVVSRKETLMVDTDEYPNRGTDEAKLASLRPAFKKDGTVTAGNASGINDGASFVLLASENAVARYGLNPLCEVTAVAQAGVDPAYMGLGPVPAIGKLIARSEMSLKDVDLFELNEAFAAQSLGVAKLLCEEHGVEAGWLSERTNVNGGAIALGHPIGASGNRIVVTLVHEMVSSGKNTGIASLCIGGGMGTALLLRRY